MTEPMRIRATAFGDWIDVKVIIPHPMESGERKDSSGRIIPAHFIHSVLAEHEGRMVLTAQCSASVARNPFLHFRFKGGKPGERVRITWIDNLGAKRSDEAAIAAGEPAG